MSQTSNVYLDKKCDLFKMPTIICDIDDLRRLRDGCNYILNMGHNTHWVALFVRGSFVAYFDSFGVVPPMHIIDLINTYAHHTNTPIQYAYNAQDIQNLQSGYCGEYAFFFLYYLTYGKGGAYSNKFRKFQRLFNTDVEDNKTILLKQLHMIGFYE